MKFFKIERIPKLSVYKKNFPFIYIIIFIVTFIGLANLSGCADRRWDASVVEQKNISDIGSEYREIVFSSRREKHTFRAYAVKLPVTKYKAVVGDRSPTDAKHYPTIDKIAKEAKAKIAINGGYFKEEFLPDGLYILKSKELSPLSNNPVLSGILSVDRNGLIDLLLSSEKPFQPVYAIQAGPFLVDPGGKMGIKTDKDPKTRRTLVALSEKKDLLLIATSETSLFKLADCLVSQPEIFGVSRIERALNLDGGPSTAMFVDLAEKPVIIYEQGPIRNSVLFFAP